MSTKKDLVNYSSQIVGNAKNLYQRSFNSILNMESLVLNNTDLKSRPDILNKLEKVTKDLTDNHKGMLKNSGVDDGDFMLMFHCMFDGKPGICTIYTRNKMSEMIMETFYNYCRHITKLI